MTSTTADPALDNPVDTTTPEARVARPSVLVTVLTTSDHKVIGQLYIGASMLGALIVGVLGVLLGAERIDGEGTLLDSNAINQLFAGYRVGLVFALAVPLFLGIALYVVPLQLGARALAFPRAAAAGFWAWFGGVVLLIVALFNNGGPFGGNHDMVELYLGAYVVMLVGITASAATIAASVLTTRAPGMRMPRVPLFAWSALVWALGLVLVLPVLVGVLIYLYVDYRYTGLLFGRAAGIASWTEFIITGPVLALFAAPAVGVSAELLPVAFRKRLPMRGIAFTGLAFVALGLLAGVSQQSVAPAKWTQEAMTRHNYATKLGDVIVYALFVVVPLVGVLMVLGVGALMGKPARGAKRRLPSVGVSAPLVFAKLGITLILLGMVGNVLLPFVDLDLQGTVFEEGVTVAFVYGILLAGLGAAAWWIPKAYGARLPDLPLFGIAALAWLGAVLASVPYGIAGFLDQPGYAAVWDNDGPGELLNTLVTIGHGLVAIAVVAMLGALAAAGRHRSTGEPDPWGSGQTLEWTTSSPAPHDNFAEVPTVMSPEPVLDLSAAPAETVVAR